MDITINGKGILIAGQFQKWKGNINYFILVSSLYALGQ